MTLFNRHERCIGLTLWRFGQKNIELWYCPSGYEIKPHSHPNEKIELMYLFGDTEFFRIVEKMHDFVFGKHMGVRSESFKPKWYHVFRKFTIDYGVVHWFKVSKLPLIFINIATFKDGHKPVSAAVDFKE